MSYAYSSKYFIIGDTGVGKSRVLLQFVDKRFQPVPDFTIGVEFGAHIVTLNNKPYQAADMEYAKEETIEVIVDNLLLRIFKRQQGVLVPLTASDDSCMTYTDSNFGMLCAKVRISCLSMLTKLELYVHFGTISMRNRLRSI